MSANKSWKKALVPMLMTCVGLAALAGMASIGNARPVAAAAGDTYELVTNAATLTAGKTYIIGAKKDSSWFFLSSTQNKNNRGQVAGTVAGTTASWVSGIEELTLGGNETAGWTFYANNSSTKGYLYAASKSSNYLKTQTSLDANAQWTISVADTGVATMRAKGTNTRNLLQYNSNSSLFACYSGAQSNGDVYLYQKVELVDESKVLKSSLVVEGALSKTEWIEKEAFSPEGLTIKARYTDSVTYPDIDVTDKIQWSTLKVGDTSITGTYTEGDVTASCVIEGITVIAKSLNGLSIANKTTAFMARTSFAFGSATITAYYDNGEKIVVAADDPNLTVYFGETDITAGYLFKDSDVDTTNKIKLVYVDGEKTATTSYTITVTAFVNPIKNVYDSANGDSVEFWGVYVGSLKDGAIVMNGDYGMILYKTSAEASWVVDETVLHVTGARTSFNNLVEINSTGINVEVVTDENVISNYVDTPINYVLSGSEDATDLSIANRRTFVNGTLKSITAAKNDYNIVVTQDGTDVNLFYKSADVVAEDLAYLQANVGKTVTIKAFTSFFKTFQARVYGIVEQDASYTAAMFAEEFLAATDTVCASYDGSSNKEALVPVWNEFGGAEKWQKLSEEEKAILLSSEKTPCYTNDSADPIENALGRYNFLCKKYELPNFMGREDVASAPVMALQPGFEHQEISSSSTAIALTTCGLGLVSAASLLLLRRKKQDRE